MRMFLRIVVLWLIVAPIGVYFGFPYLVATMQDRTRAEAHAQCVTQTAAAPEAFDSARPEIATGYCACIRDGITLTRDDLLAIIQRKEATALTASLSASVDRCTDELSSPLAHDGTETLIF